MAKGFKTGGRSFVKGQSGNPSGRRKLTEKEQAVKVMTQTQFAEIAELMMTKTKEQLMDILAGTIPYEMELFIRHMLDLGEAPNWSNYERYLRRRIGDVPQNIEVSGNFSLEDLIAGSREDAD
jgi:hypothetical protein